MNAYDEILPMLHNDPRWAVPTRVAQRDALRAFVSTSLAGAPGEQTTDEDARAMHQCAGALARHVHSLPHDESSDSRAIMQDRLDRHLQPRDGLPEGLLHDTREALDDAKLFASHDVVVTHGDYSPRNWVFERTSNGPRVGVFDWERACPFIALEDMQRMAYDYWYEDPACRNAFFAGYGRGLTSRESDALRLLSWAASVAAIPWAHMTGDTAFETLCYAMLERIADEASVS